VRQAGHAGSAGKGVFGRRYGVEDVGRTSMCVLGERRGFALARDYRSKLELIAQKQRHDQVNYGDPPDDWQGLAFFGGLLRYPQKVCKRSLTV
jgi:hypothetical protein